MAQPKGRIWIAACKKGIAINIQKHPQINDHFRKIAARFGTTSMIIRRSGIIKLLEFSKNQNIYLPYDLENYFPEGIQRYGLTFDLVTNMLNSLSDIGAPDYLNSPQ